MSFASIHQAIKAEKILAQNGIPSYALPTPREIDISCGQCLLFAAKQQDTLLSLFAATKVRWSKLFSRTSAGDSVYIFEKITEYGG
ncbi:DUF3343 domain-containing protein [Sporomusa sp.]|uniref:DUF3343 domain-containing protein n=1 Tax=Sporomusa sp. TaxID=2078658 RepID=UPI002D1DBEF7|nr:DUF3343 domain-containing protein [Sporomusa sp.]HWR44072.1 DUF3343 domain-containing protein [Sporomusa sp.]